jgi:hypothetical protein
MVKSYLYLTNCGSILIVVSKYPKSFNDADLIGSKDGNIHPRHHCMLNQFKMSNGLYMMSEQLLLVISKTFKIDYEDLWNLIYLRSDRSNQEFFSTREEELVLNGLGILGDQAISDLSDQLS